MFNQMTFAVDRGTPRAAREFVRSALAGERVDGVGDVSELLTTELVTNAVQHAQSAATVRLFTEEGRLRIEVDDTSAVLPVVQRRDPARPSGYGLQLVEGFSDNWGADVSPGGKTVWFELALPES